MTTSRLDAMYRSFLLTKFFTKGWGKPENLRRLFEFRKVVSNREECFKLVERDYPVTITKEQNLTDCRLLEGYFLTPLERHLPGIVPQIAQKAHFQAVLPINWPEPGCKPVCLHLAGTGDHFFWRRRNLMVKPLIKEAGIGGIILENPFYGLRKPTDQVRSSLHNVSDIFVMGGCLILEALVLFHWCERNGLGPLGVTGLSMGGHMASLAATNWPKPLVLVPCLSWSTASAVFLQGVMSQSINWDLLEYQYLSDGEYRDKLSKMVTIVDEAFLAGKKFAQNFSETVQKGEDAQTNKETDKKPDISYEEAAAIKLEKQVVKTIIKSEVDTKLEKSVVNEIANEIVDVSKNVLELEKIPKNVVKSESFAQMENLNEELNKLLEEKKISRALFDKLTTNAKFELEPEDIDYINKLNRAKLKEVLLRCKVADIKNDSSNRPPPSSGSSTQSDTKRESDHKTDDKQTPNDDKPSINLKSVAAATSTDKIKLLVTKPRLDRRSWHVSDLTSDLWTNLPFLRSERKIDISKIHWRDREALQFMRGIMDECTHLSNFSVPYDTSLIIAVCAKHDAYVPREDVGTLEEIWPGAEVRYVDAGHVSAYILHQSLFRSSIVEAFERSKKRWKDGKHVA